MSGHQVDIIWLDQTKLRLETLLVRITKRTQFSLDPKMCTFQFPTCTSYLLLCLWVQHDTHWAFSHWIPLFGKDPFQLGDDSIVVEVGGCQVTQVLSVNNKSTAYIPYGRWGKTLWDCCRKCLNFNCHCRSQSFEGLIARSASGRKSLHPKSFLLI